MGAEITRWSAISIVDKPCKISLVNCCSRSVRPYADIKWHDPLGWAVDNHGNPLTVQSRERHETAQRPDLVSTRATATSAGSSVLGTSNAARPATASTAVGNREAAKFPSGKSRSHSSTPGDINSGCQSGPSTIIPVHRTFGIDRLSDEQRPAHGSRSEVSGKETAHARREQRVGLSV